MFYVRNKETGEVRAVYGISGLYFIMWDKVVKTWISDDIYKYEPMEA